MFVCPKSKIKATPLLELYRDAIVYLLETMSKEGREVVVELTVDHFEVMFKVS